VELAESRISWIAIPTKRLSMQHDRARVAWGRSGANNAVRVDTIALTFFVTLGTGLLDGGDGTVGLSSELAMLPGRPMTRSPSTHPGERFGLRTEPIQLCQTQSNAFCAATMACPQRWILSRIVAERHSRVATGGNVMNLTRASATGSKVHRAKSGCRGCGTETFLRAEHEAGGWIALCSPLLRCDAGSRDFRRSVALPRHCAGPASTAYSGLFPSQADPAPLLQSGPILRGGAHWAEPIDAAQRAYAEQESRATYVQRGSRPLC